MKLNAYCKRFRREVYPPKIILFMKLMTIMLFISCMQLNAAAFSQIVNLHKQKVSLAEVFKEIRIQTGYDFVFTQQQMARAVPVSIDAANRPLAEVLARCFESQPLSYTIENKTIVVKDKPSSQISSKSTATQNSSQQEFYASVKGKIRNSIGTPLPDASINVISSSGNKTTQGTKTDERGEFVLQNVPRKSSLEISLIGHASRTVRTSVDVGEIILTPVEIEIEDLVVVGYTRKKASDITGSVQAVSGDELRSSVSTPNVLSMLKGKTTGLYITESSGESGQKGQLVARGQSSMATSTNSYLGPLIVVDGVITNYQSLQDAVNPADIEDVSILKDAASTAIYGSRSAQGVIVVTTKRGQTGRSSVEARFQSGILQPVRNVRFMNTTELINFMDTQMVRYWEQTPSMQATFPQVEDFVRERRIYTEEDRNRNFNWEDVIYSDGNFNNMEVGVRHGTDKTKFYAGIGWFKENGALYDNGFDRKNFRLNIDHDISNKFHISMNVSSIIDRTTRRNGVPELYMVQPFMTPYAADGTLLDSIPVSQSNNYGPAFTTWTQNFLAEEAYDNTQLTSVQNHLATARLQYDILPYLSIQSTNSINYVGTNGNSYLDPRTFSGKYGGYPYLFRAGQPTPNGTLAISETKFVDYLTSNTLNFRKTYAAQHSVTALVGQEWGKRTTESMNLDMYDILPDERNIGAGKYFGSPLNLAYNMPYRPTGGFQERATFSVFGQADYSYAGRYMTSASIRTDATTNFGRDRRYGTFYSFSGGWLVSEEDFLKNVKAINNLRLRVSYGTSGRDLGDGYLNRTFYAQGLPYEKLDNLGYTINQLANPAISWETMYNTNIGLDVSAWNNRVSLTVDAYHKRNDGLLQQVTLPAAQGALTQYQNIGEIVNRGIEIMLNTHNVKTTDFNWHSSINFSYNKNELTKLYRDSLQDSYTRLYHRHIGDDINAIKAIRFAGINPENGNMQHYNVDANGNEVVVEGIGDISNKANWQTIGQATPRFFGGFTNTFSYRNYSLSAEWWFQVGNYTQMLLISNFQSPTSPRVGYNNIAFGDNQRVWQGPGDTDANYPDVFSLDPNAWQSMTFRSSKLWGNASHARLRNVRFTYSMPDRILNSLKMSRANIFLSGDNLFVIKHKDFVGTDPEGAELNQSTTRFLGPGTGIGLANPRRFTMGIELTF